MTIAIRHSREQKLYDTTWGYITMDLKVILT